MDSKPIPKPLTAPEGQGADFVELFFDLVFVFAITQVTRLTAHHLDQTTVLRSLLVFWMIWWGWTAITWALNAANTRRGEIRIATLIATAVAFVMAVSTPQAFDQGVLLFAGSYSLVRLIGMGLFLRITWADPEERASALGFTVTSLLGLAAVMAGAFSSESARVLWWLGAIGLDLLAGYVSGRVRGLHINVGHFAERHGLIVIIALGESLIVAGAAVVGDEKTTALMTAGAVAVVVTCLLWWTYFGWAREYLEEGLEKLEQHSRVLAARDGYSFLHFPLVCGVISLAVGFENILSHPQDPLTAEVAAALGLGATLFVGMTAGAMWRVTGLFLWPRAVLVMGTCGALFFAVGQPPAVGLSIVAAGLALIVGVERRMRATRQAGA